MSRSQIRVVAGGLCLVLGVASAVLAGQTGSSPVASAPRVVRVDGQFVPANGLPPAAVETVTLALYASASDTTPIWEETQDLQVGADGRYVIFLGAMSAEGLPVSLFAGDAQRWLGMRFARPGEAEQPRVLLTSVPYAMRAADADTLGGLPPSAFLRAAGSKKSGSASASPGGASALDRARVPTVSTGTANFIGKFTSAVDLTSSVLFENNGRIGVNTTAPLDFLHSRFTNSDGTQTGLAVQNLGSSNFSYSGMLFYDQNGALGQFQGFNNGTHEYRINNIASGGSINFMLGGQSRFFVRPDGDLEITGNIRKNGAIFLNNRGGPDSVGLGQNALRDMTSGANVAIGSGAMQTSTTANRNNVIGGISLFANNGTGNNVLGYGALQSTNGSFNIAIGDQAGASRASGDYNIYLGSGVATGGQTESGTIRIGDNGNYSTFYAGGIRGVTTAVANAVSVVIDNQGQLGTISSSRRFKTDIQDMAEASSGLMRLRPVTYRYKKPYADGSMPIDYGLIAEEVAEIYPDIVTHQADGQAETVQYHKVNAMLLNEVQKQHRENIAQQAEIEELRTRLTTLERLIVSDKK